MARRAGDTASTFSVVSPWGLAGQNGLEAAEDQWPKERKEEPALNDFIYESFSPAVGFHGVTLAREPREKVSRTRRGYISPGGQLNAREETLRNLGHIYPPITTPPGIVTLRGSVAGRTILLGLPRYHPRANGLGSMGPSGKAGVRVPLCGEVGLQRAMDFTRLGLCG